MLNYEHKSHIKVKKFGEIITKQSIPLGIKNNNINGPVVFKRPYFFPDGPKWIMYFAHHHGEGIRIAQSDSLISDWVVSDELVFNLDESPGYDHVASPEVLVLKDQVELFYHCKYEDFQYTFKSITRDGLHALHQLT